MSMPAGFSNTPAYNLPTSFSGNFQQAFPGQGFPQPQAYAQQPNGTEGESGFAIIIIIIIIINGSSSKTLCV